MFFFDRFIDDQMKIDLSSILSDFQKDRENIEKKYWNALHLVKYTKLQSVSQIHKTNWDDYFFVTLDHFWIKYYSKEDEAVAKMVQA